jgi:hypothetical protein
LEKEKAFQAYLETSKQFATVKLKASEAKLVVKVLLQKRSKELAEYGDSLDFTVSGDRVQLFKKASSTRKSRRGHEIEI